MKRVAVIGAGIFGSETAILLKKNGYEVTIFERENNILIGASKSSILRLHLGFHYPRDLDTAIQSRIGYTSFLNRFPSVVDFNFRNFYAVALENSKISNRQFLDFVKAAGIDMSEVQKDELDDLGFANDKIDSLFQANEGVICMPRLRTQLLQEIDLLGIKVVFDTEVIRATKSRGKWIIKDKNNEESEFDFVVRATYGHDRMQIVGETSTTSRQYEFHKTLVLDVNINLQGVGMTVIDGDFLTVLPKANAQSHLIYAPSPSRMKVFTGETYPKEWDQLEEESIRRGEAALIQRYKEWFKKDIDILVNERLVTVRAVESGVKRTDRRTSSISTIAEKFFDIHSGKIDHCVGTSNEVLNLLQIS